jgi:hypothetical protein
MIDDRYRQRGLIQVIIGLGRFLQRLRQRLRHGLQLNCKQGDLNIPSTRQYPLIAHGTDLTGSRAMSTANTDQGKARPSNAGNTRPGTLDEFAGFLANPADLKRGGIAIQAARGPQRRGLLERLAQAAANRLLRAEIAARHGK